MSTVLDAFSADGAWYRGNCHLHSTNSDGRLSPQEAADLYHEQGYHFLAISDHWRRTDPSEVDPPDNFLMVPAEEIGGYTEADDLGWHAVGLFLEREVEKTIDQPVQWGVDALREAGGDVVLAHPRWIGMLVHQILPVDGLLGIEIFNSLCERGQGRGHALFHWDALWHAGRRPWGFAVDDTHTWAFDGVSGWIMVKAPELSLDALRTAIRAGHFYASTGPEIHEIAIADGDVTVRCSPCEIVRVQSNQWMGKTAYAAAERRGPGHPLTEVTLPYNKSSTFVRVTCTDAAGNSAWSNPVDLTQD